jgi:hypothetical protein
MKNALFGLWTECLHFAAESLNRKVGRSESFQKYSLSLGWDLLRPIRVVKSLPSSKRPSSLNIGEWSEASELGEWLASQT